MPIILTVNTGSSSIRYQCFEMVGEVCLATGQIDRLNSATPELSYRRHDDANYQLELKAQPYEKWLPLICATLTDAQYGIINDLSAITAVGHRVVHGGNYFSSPALITPSVEALIEQHADLAPLHNPFSLRSIRASAQVLKEVPQVAVFDTAFHQTIPAYAHVYPIPYHFYQEYDIRRYGFHGTSHRYVAQRAADMLGQPIESLKIISCHLGSGASVTAIDGGKSVDTSMGFTPLEGLMMGTRCGDIDPALIFQLINQHQMSVDQIEQMLNNRSGLLGISGVSADIRDLLDHLSEQEAVNERVLLALNMFCYRVSQYIGQYAATLGGLDVLVFTGGIGENAPRIRTKICHKLGFLGIKLSNQQNGAKGREKAIHQDQAEVKVLAIPTDEGLMIARDTLQLLQQVPDPPNPVTEFERLISLVEERDQASPKMDTEKHRIDAISRANKQQVTTEDPFSKTPTEVGPRDSNLNSSVVDSSKTNKDRSVQVGEPSETIEEEPLVAPSAWLSVYNKTPNKTD